MNNSINEITEGNQEITEGNQEIITNFAHNESLDYRDDTENYSTTTGKIIRVNERFIKSIVKTTIKYKVIDKQESNLLYDALCIEFNKIGAYGKGNKFSSISLDKVRAKTHVFLNSVISEKDVIFTNNTYFFICQGGKIAKCEGLIIKQASIGDMFTDTNRSNDKLTLETLKEIKAISEPVPETAVQALTK